MNTSHVENIEGGTFDYDWLWSAAGIYCVKVRDVKGPAMPGTVPPNQELLHMAVLLPLKNTGRKRGGQPPNQAPIDPCLLACTHLSCPRTPNVVPGSAVWWTEYGRSESLLGLAYRRLQLLSWSLFLESLTLGEALLWAALWKGPLVRNWSLLPAATWLSLDTHPLVPVRFSETVVLGKSWKATHPAKPLLDSWPSETMWDSKHLLC